MQLGMQVVFLLNFLGFGMALAPACLGSQAVESPALGMLLGFASAPASDFAQVGFHCLWCIRHKVSCEVDWHSGRCQACLLLQFLQGLLHVVPQSLLLLFAAFRNPVSNHPGVLDGDLSLP